MPQLVTHPGTTSPRHTPKSPRLDRLGFTLVELLVVIVIISVLSSLGVYGYRSAMLKSKQVECLGNMRQIGLAVVIYGLDNHGRFPQASHRLDASNYEQSWIHTLEPYLDGFDEARISPVDPKREQRLEEGGTSYILNSFLTVEKIDSFGQVLPGNYSRMNQVPQPAQTPLAFIVNFESGTGQTNDHTHSDTWTSWGSVLEDIEVDAFRLGSPNENRTKGSSNYLFVDGHVENLKASTVRGWITSGYNFADPAATK